MSETSKPTKAWQAWTTGQERTLAALRREGRTLREIAEQMGRTYRSIAKQCERMGAGAARQKSSRMREYYRELQVIHTIPQVAARMRVKPDTVTSAKCALRRKGLSVCPARRKKSLMTDTKG
jgi:transposase